MEDFVQIKDDKIFWGKLSKFILDNKDDKLGDFFKRCALKFNFDNKNIFKLRVLAKDKLEELIPKYFSKICWTTELFSFLIRDTLKYCGVIENKMIPPNRIKSNYLYAKILYEDMNKYIHFLEGLNLINEENKNEDEDENYERNKNEDKNYEENKNEEENYEENNNEEENYEENNNEEENYEENNNA